MYSNDCGQRRRVCIVMTLWTEKEGVYSNDCGQRRRVCIVMTVDREGGCV